MRYADIQIRLDPEEEREKAEMKDAKKQWEEQALGLLLRLGRRLPEFSNDDLRDAVEEHLPPHPDYSTNYNDGRNNPTLSVLNGAVKAGLIRVVDGGKTVNSRRVSRHRSRILVYELVEKPRRPLVRIGGSN